MCTKKDANDKNHIRAGKTPKFSGVGNFIFITRDAMISIVIITIPLILIGKFEC
jgi:hypothetical protein